VVEDAGTADPSGPGVVASPPRDQDMLGPVSTPPSKAPAAAGDDGVRDSATAVGSDAGSWLPALSLAMLGAGIGLFVARRLARSD
jgi:hypothetical protein